MFCVNCGKENDDGVVFCSSCGKPPKGVAVSQRNTYPLTNFTAKSFNVLFEVILWVILIGGVVVGGIIGYQASFLLRADLTFLGILIGGAASFVQVILLGGLVSLFIKLVNNSDEIKKKNE